MIGAYLYTLLYALMCAWKDYWDITHRFRIAHGSSWVIRAGSVLLVIVWLAALSDRPWWIALTTAAGCGAMFSLVFRLALNKMREKSWKYLSPSAHYDWAFIRLFMRRYPREQALEDWVLLQYSQDARRAGVAASVFEIAVFAVSLWLSITRTSS